MKLNGLKALITGASRGIGHEIALAFAAEGADLAVTARSADAIEDLKSQVTAFGANCAAIPADLEHRGSVAPLVEKTLAALGRVDILVNNAGLGSSSDPRPLVDFNDEFWERSLYLNLTVPYLLTKALVPGMIERGWGRIINIASIASVRGAIHGAAYAASKSGLVGLTRALSREVVRNGVTVNAINPGPTRTVMNDKRIAYDANRLGKTTEEIERMATPLGRRLELKEIAPFAVWLASREASAITGQAINVDGGCTVG